MLLVGLLLSACSQPRIEDHHGFEPTLDVERFFDGELAAYGVARNRSGNVIKTFSANISASNKAGTVILDEQFEFNDGKTENRLWQLRPQDDGSWSASAGDVVGEGNLRSAGNALYLDYVLRIPYGDGTIDVRVDDRMYLVAPNIIVNQSKMLKFGVEVGSILLVIVRDEGVL